MEVKVSKGNKMTLKELRKANNLTQSQCASYLGIPLRTYQNYETIASKANSLKYLYMQQRLEKYSYVDEKNGILSIKKNNRSNDFNI